MIPPGLSPRDRLALLTQNLVSYCFAPFMLTLSPLLFRVMYRWRVRDHRRLRKLLRRELSNVGGPVVVCANHLTMFDSAIIAWALAPPWWYMFHFKKLPWNVPEKTNFARGFLSSVGVYLAKCIPVVRGGDRRQVSLVLKKLRHLLTHGHTVLIFPEGRRSRTGRVDRTNPALATGRIIKGLPNVRVLCVYLRGDHQVGFSNLPVHGEVFYFATSWLEPHTEHEGLRGSVEICEQIMRRIQEMEGRFFNGRQ